jgi:vitamin B12 transporter
VLTICCSQLVIPDHETFGGTLTWNAEYAYEMPGPRTRLAVAAGRAFHAPDSTDRFGFGGNPDLRPELSRQIELTLRQPFGSAHSVFLTAYRNDVDNLINYVVTDFATFDGRNSGSPVVRFNGSLRVASARARQARPRNW